MSTFNRSSIRRQFAAIGATAALATMLLAAQSAHAAGDIAFTTDHAYPESVSWSAKEHAFIVSSVRHGNVGKVTLDGRYSVLIDDAKLVSSVGVLVDDNRNAVWVMSSDPGAGDKTRKETQGRMAAAGVYDLASGKRLAWYDLGVLSEGTHFANDVTLDAAGNAYVTDSFAPLIYRIDKNGKPSIFARNPLFKTDDGFNLNGIAWHRDGYLLVDKYNTGELFRVSVADPTHVEQVRLPEALKGADGMHLIDGQHLIVVQNQGIDRTVELESTDGWNSAQIVRTQKSRLSMPSAATQVGDEVYVLNSRIDNLFDPKAEKVNDFLLQKF